MRILRPRDPADAIASLCEHGPAARLAAGATALQLDWANGTAPPEVIVDLSGLTELLGITQEGDCLRIGAAVPLAEIACDTRVVRDLPLLAEAIAGVGAPGVRVLATLGGNVAGRTGCCLPALLALDAELELCPDAGQAVPLAAWLGRVLDPASLVVAVRVPIQRLSDRATLRKIGLRAAFSPSVIGVAGRLRLEGGRIAAARLAVGGGPVASRRLPEAEARLAGCCETHLDWSALHAALLGEIEAPDDAARSGAYRRLAAANALVAGLGGVAALPRRAPSRASRPPAGPPPVGERILSRAANPAAWHVRPDIADKVHGRLAYLTDARVPGMLVGRILRAGMPHARIVSLETAAAEALPGVSAVVTHRDVPGLNAFGIMVQDQPALCDTLVRYVGDAVAAVAAVDDTTARAALALIRVGYAPLPVVDSPEAALAEGAPRLHPEGNLRREVVVTRGDAAAALADCAHIVSETYVTPRQMHGFLETEGGWAALEPDGSLTIRAGGQHGARDRLQLARILGWPEARIRVVTSPTGGAFGGKDELTVQPALALLALKAGRPVRLHLDRAESVAAGVKRNPMRIRMRSGCDAQGRLCAVVVDVLADGGAYASLSPAVIETALEHACGPYRVPNFDGRARLVATNNGTCGAFRGFGANEMTFAIESQIGRLAELAGLDPVAMRRRNLRAPGSPGALGQRVGPSERLAEMLDAAAASPLWSPDAEADRAMESIGTGMALNYQGNGLGSLPEDRAAVTLALAADGAIEARYGLDEIGQGLQTAIRSAVAARLGVAREDVRAVTGDTAAAPDSGSTTASRGSFVVWMGAQRAGVPFAGALLTAGARVLGRPAEELALGPGGLCEAQSNSRRCLLTFAELAARLPEMNRPRADAVFAYPKTDYVAGNARYLFAFGATLARVAVDRATGQVRVLDLHQHTAAGPVLDAAAYLGQIEGGGVQGLGFTLSEDALMAGGRYLTGNLDRYMLPGIADAPLRSRVLALPDLDASDPYGPRGIGELGIGAVTPAIAAAVADATGFWPSVTPISPEALLQAVGGGAGAS
ncbi:molybdopterin cofactor-binding domain-containing protein [Methylobacterium sp. Leaf89]|uniref:molybdopterin cofactor-binding domain-containing protein n=1 Tax=Methylobacterium sp. Leaf89 TaxID=1736245 RepID=UPI0006F9A609|nr:molybdopterin cofactor-binding domain-containing protein [Methylobacterium sp. Leaf89]KQO73587.1 aldehyde oxidase [Methylobacterium sp. Leaf89]